MTVVERARAEAHDLGPDIGWLVDALWPEADFDPATGTADRVPTRRFLANPRPDDCRLLVPTASRRAAAESVRRYHNAATTKGRAVMVATEAALGVGAGRLLGPRTVDMPWPCAPPFLAAIERHLGWRAPHVAFTLGPRRQNRKPVAQLFDGSGRTLGFAKLGVDPYTDELVRTEAHWLQLAHAASCAALRVPEPLLATRVASGEVSVLAPAWATRRPVRNPRALDPRVVEEIHALVEPREGSVLESAAAIALASATESEAAATLAAVADHGRAATEPLRLGAWHGDLTPWNILTVNGQAVVIDWETAEAAMPLGLDVLNAAVGAGMQLDGLSPTAALRSVHAASADLLKPFNLSEGQRAGTWLVLLLEHVRRDLDLQRIGRDPSGLGDAALTALAGASR